MLGLKHVESFQEQSRDDYKVLASFAHVCGALLRDKRRKASARQARGRHRPSNGCRLQDFGASSLQTKDCSTRSETREIATASKYEQC